MRFFIVLLLLFMVNGLFAQKNQDTVGAHYPGGQAAWLRYALQHFRLPGTLNEEYSSVSLVFEVSDKGYISDVRMVKGDTLLRKTFADLLVNSSPWVPATTRGRPVQSTRTFFMHYHLSFAQADSITRKDFIFKGPIYNNPGNPLIKNGNREVKDSLHYVVITGKYISGTVFIEIIKDPRSKIYYWKQFFPNGQLKETGAMTKDEIICIGKWTYYQKKKKIDTIIDYDSKLPIPYVRAMVIAQAQGYEMPGLDIDLLRRGDYLYWQVRKWLMRNGDGISSTILINTVDGSITKPAEEVEKHY